MGSAWSDEPQTWLLVSRVVTDSDQCKGAYIVELNRGDILGAPIRGTKLNVVMNVAGVPDVWKVKEDLAVGGNRIAFTLARRPQSLQLLRRLSAAHR